MKISEDYAPGEERKVGLSKTRLWGHKNYFKRGDWKGGSAIDFVKGWENRSQEGGVVYY